MAANNDECVSPETFITCISRRGFRVEQCNSISILARGYKGIIRDMDDDSCFTTETTEIPETEPVLSMHEILQKLWFQRDILSLFKSVLFYRYRCAVGHINYICMKCGMQHCNSDDHAGHMYEGCSSIVTRVAQKPYGLVSLLTAPKNQTSI